MEKYYYIKDGKLNSIADLLVQYMVELGEVTAVADGVNRYILKEDYDKINDMYPGYIDRPGFGLMPAEDASPTFYGSVEFQTLRFRAGDCKATITDGHMITLGEPSKLLFDNAMKLMQVLKIKRIIFTCRRDLTGISEHVSEIKDVRMYHKLDRGDFSEEILTGVYQIYNDKGKHFLNGPFQQCNICKNWFMFGDNELEFFAKHEIARTRTCKRCKGRKVH